MKLELAKGMRDIAPAEMIALNKIVRQLEKVFARYGYSPLSTPVVERFDVLASKYAGGAEILKEIFRVTDQGERDLCLRYDLTVPLARYVGMNPQLKLPFKRYQVSSVYRDGPVGPGRYREFIQCDVDVVGPKKPLVDAEIFALVQDAFVTLGLPDVQLIVNDRLVLNGMVSIFAARELDAAERDSAILTIDKLDKVGRDGVVKELVSKGLFAAPDALTLLEGLEQFAQDARDVSTSQVVLREFLSFLTEEAELRSRSVEIAGEGVTYLQELFAALGSMNVSIARFSPFLARGLSYYTGVVFEVRKEGVDYSLAGGGRYDKMIGNFLGSGREFPACGISFGLERIALTLGLADEQKTLTQVFVLPVGKVLDSALGLVAELRAAGVNCEVDLLGKGVSKNLDFANKMGIPYVVFVGQRELDEGKFKVKNMVAGGEQLVSRGQLATTLLGLFS